MDSPLSMASDHSTDVSPLSSPKISKVPLSPESPNIEKRAKRLSAKMALKRMPSHETESDDKYTRAKPYDKPAKIKKNSRPASPVSTPTSPKSIRDEERTVKCNTCGKVYKNQNCLSKHHWEHTAFWEYARQFSLSKHQQVQLMEASNILVKMREHHDNNVPVEC
eukprot:Colp12_sorted_trinity150504_noHs@10299